jgi:hypothetical protein
MNPSNAHRIDRIGRTLRIVLVYALFCV